MSRLPDPVDAFLRGKRFAVAGVSRDRNQTGNAVYRKLLKAGYEVVPVNPAAQEVEGVRCYPDLASLPAPVDGVVAVTPPGAGVDLVRKCAEAGIPRIWFHRAFGEGSVSEAAVAEARARGVQCIAGGCPLMYCSPVDPVHRCIRWWLGRKKRVPV
jgi:predicted CoA-binding protein